MASSISEQLNIRSSTTGFASPAESYVDKRLDLNELIIENTYSTFFFKYGGMDTLGVEKGDVLVVDKNQTPNYGDLVILTDSSCFKIRQFEGQPNLWGKVSWILKKK